MQLDPHEQKLGHRWFFGAGIFGLLLVSFIVNADRFMSLSNREQVRRDEMNELRVAQTTLRSGPVDPRETQEGVFAGRKAPEVVVEESHDSHGHH